MHIEMSVLRDFQLDIELRVAPRSVKFQAGVVATNLEIDVRVFHIPLVVRLDRVAQTDLIRIAVPDVQVADAEADMNHAAGNEIAGIGVGLLVVPVIGSGTDRNQQQTGKYCLVEHGEAHQRSREHGSPRQARALIVIRKVASAGSTKSLLSDENPIQSHKT